MLTMASAQSVYKLKQAARKGRSPRAERKPGVRVLRGHRARVRASMFSLLSGPRIAIAVLREYLDHIINVHKHLRQRDDTAEAHGVACAPCT